MSEFITIQVGQCGNQIGSALWPLILQEYNISLLQNTETKTNQNDCDIQRSFSSFFNIKPTKGTRPLRSFSDLLSNNVKARAVCIDMEDSVVSRFNTGTLKGLFDKKCLITNYPGSGNNWAEGYCEHGPKYHNKILNAIQYAVEKCDSLHGFLLLFSTGGGTGSGLGTYVLKLLADNYPNVDRFVACVYPTGTEDVITCPYNMAFATQELLNYASCIFPVENRALLNILSRQLKNGITHNNTYISMHTPFEDLNSIIVNMLLHLTSGSRFPGSLNFDMNELNTNMVPFPKLNFLSSGFSQFQFNTPRNNKPISKQLKDEFYIASCNRINQLVKVDPMGPKSVLMGTTLIGRGHYTLTDMRSYVEKIQRKAKFTPWSLKSVKIGLCNVAPYKTSLAMFSMFNTSSMSNLFEHIDNQFVKLYQKKAHVHHYTKISDFEEDNFQMCLNSLRTITSAYKGIERMKPANIPRLSPLMSADADNKSDKTTQL